MPVALYGEIIGDGDDWADENHCEEPDRFILDIVAGDVAEHHEPEDEYHEEEHAAADEKRDGWGAEIVCGFRTWDELSIHFAASLSKH